MSWLTTTREGIRDDLPLVYLIRIAAPGGEIRYLGKAKNKSRFRRDYHANVTKILAGEIKRNGNGKNKKGNARFRAIHLYLAAAVEEGWLIEHVAVENASKGALKECERRWENKMGNFYREPSWDIEDYQKLKMRIANE
jgi:hypothetical protein